MKCQQNLRLPPRRQRLQRLRLQKPKLKKLRPLRRKRLRKRQRRQSLAGDVGLLDTEKNYMILVTKEGKLVTIDFDAKTKATEITPSAAKMADIGLGSSAVVVYEKAGEKNIATSLEFKAAKGE